MFSKKRTRNLARPRQVAMSLARELTDLSFPEIGQSFGGRDHTTVLHACNKIEELTRMALKKYPAIPFSLVNADDKKNEKQCSQFQAYGSSLFLYNTKTKKIKNLTEMAFMNAGNQEKFIKEFNKNMEAFLKS